MSTRRRPSARLIRRLILSAVLGLAVGVLAWYLGMDAAHAAGLGAAGFALSACLSALGEAADVAWAPAPAAARPGARRDLAQVGWSFGSRGGRASAEGVRRVREIAERALALRGLQLEDRSAEAELTELLGPDLLRLLRRGSAAQVPRSRDIAAALDRLEALAPPAGVDTPAGFPSGAAPSPRTATESPIPEEPPRAH